LPESSPGRHLQVVANPSDTALRPLDEGVFDAGQHHTFRGEVKVGHDTVIWTLEMPENIVYDGLATFVAGLSGIEGSSQRFRGAMASEGIATASYSPARKGASWYETATHPQILHAKTVGAIGKAISNSTEIKKHAPNARAVDANKKLLLAHSMGGLGATEYALHEPGSVDGLVKLAACGYGHPTLRELAIDVPLGMHLGLWHELIPSLLEGDIKPSLSNVRDMLRYFSHLRAIIEGNSCLRQDSRESIAKLRQGGIFVAYQAYEHDILVRADPAVADHVDFHEIMLGAGHLAPIRKSPRVAKRISQIILAR
jgi:hypothetical protein